MTIPKVLDAFPRTVADMVRGMLPRHTEVFLPEESELVVHLRGNRSLFNALKVLIEARLRGRAHSPVPTDPVDCKAVMERDHELRWLLSRLSLICESSEAQPVEDDSEHLV